MPDETQHDLEDNEQHDGRFQREQTAVTRHIGDELERVLHAAQFDVWTGLLMRVKTPFCRTGYQSYLVQLLPIASAPLSV